MTRTEFCENVTSWSDLLEFCRDEGCEICDDVYSDEQRDEYINEALVDIAENAGNWYNLLGLLQDIETGYDYYIRDEYDEWTATNNYEAFDEFKNDVLDWMDNAEYWDEEEDEDNDLEEDDLEEEEFIDEDISIQELFASCGNEFTFMKGKVL